MGKRSRLLLEIDSRGLERSLAHPPLLILPVGALEAHGPHLPLGADQFQAEATATALAEKVDALVAPTLPYGACPGTRRFPGTVSISLSALTTMAREILEEYGRMGFTRILVLSGHAERGHMAALREAGERARAACPTLRVVVLSDYDFVYERRGLDAPAGDGHGGLLETSRVMAVAPETVGAARPVVEHRGSPFVPGSPSVDEWPESVQGDTRTASAELGSRLQSYVLERLEATVRSLLPE
ncbi:MAG: creatininase family protein [Thermoplasmata archaeon]|nr:creatininase family protein [Thermoplasmata archaeon]